MISDGFVSAFNLDVRSYVVFVCYLEAAYALSCPVDVEQNDSQKATESIWANGSHVSCGEVRISCSRAGAAAVPMLYYGREEADLDQSCCSRAYGID